MDSFFLTIDKFFNTYTTEVIGGLLVAILILIFEKMVSFFQNIKIKNMYSGYIGDYYLYSFSSSGEDIITITNLSIQTHWGKLIAKANIGDIYQYTGTMYITERNLYINLKGVNHLEQVQLIFHSPLHRKIKNMVGALNAISVIDEPFSSICILSDKKISEDDIKKEFSKIGITYKNSMFKVSKNSSLFFNNIETTNQQTT